MSQTGRTIYARMPAWACRGLLAVVLVLTLLPARPHVPLYIPGERNSGGTASQFGDAMLYKAIVGRMMAGENYYPAAAAEHRLHHYPTSPPQVFREPTLAWILTQLRFDFLRSAMLLGLYGIVLVMVYRELLAAGKSFPTRMMVVATLATGLSIAGVSRGVYMHEIWAGDLIAISLLSYRPGFWWPALLCGLAACLIRELALPYLLVMALFAFHERRWKELWSWLSAVVLFAALFALHLVLAGKYHAAGDLVSRSWVGLGGWDFALATAKWNIVLHELPYPLIALAVCVGAIGLAGAHDGRAHRAAVLIIGYLTAFLVVGRPDNYYWGILFAPLLPVGFLFAPAALRDLFQSAFPRTKTT